MAPTSGVCPDNVIPWTGCIASDTGSFTAAVTTAERVRTLVVALAFITCTGALFPTRIQSRVPRHSLPLQYPSKKNVARSTVTVVEFDTAVFTVVNAVPIFRAGLFAIGAKFPVVAFAKTKADGVVLKTSVDPVSGRLFTSFPFNFTSCTVVG